MMLFWSILMHWGWFSCMSISRNTPLPRDRIFSNESLPTLSLLWSTLRHYDWFSCMSISRNTPLPRDRIFWSESLPSNYILCCYFDRFWRLLPLPLPGVTVQWPLPLPLFGIYFFLLVFLKSSKSRYVLQLHAVFFLVEPELGHGLSKFAKS